MYFHLEETDMKTLLIVLTQICTVSAAFLFYMASMWLNYLDSPVYLGLNPMIAMPLVMVCIFFPHVVRKYY